MSDSDEALAEILENEWYLVRHSGEIPEIALNASLYYLARAKDGPRHDLTPDELKTLQLAAVDRFREIVLRDLDHGNVGRTLYRGIARSYANYQRFLAFCARQGLDAHLLRQETLAALALFLDQEIAEIRETGRETVLNCSHTELCDYAALLEAAPFSCLAELKLVCPVVGAPESDPEPGTSSH